MTETTANQSSWQDKMAEKQKILDESGLWAQMGFISNNKIDCEPVLLFKKHDNNFFPIVIEAPTGLSNPKYSWEKHMWVDQDATSNSVRLNNVEKAVQSAQEQAKSVSTENQTLKDSLSNIEKGQKDQTQTLAQVVQMMAPLLAPKTNDGGSTNA